MHTSCPLVDIAALKRRINALAAQPIQAEISGEAHYYLLNTYPGEDMRALRWLARRRFGVWRPMYQGRDGRLYATFSGWLLVYCWDIESTAAASWPVPASLGCCAPKATSQSPSHSILFRRFAPCL